ncbi:Alkanal monooxygenase alpha chain [Geodia barretti]|uniref:Alkanal monooxygenase alpha chain n=1 Tax=Geodia barretti TaxID=519541 RepID=A0AA35RJZ4_GEOBA|nr:Alkanal monooxygenase alpha chain [Geodia barretti]
MKLFRLSRIDQVPIATATPIEGWTGGEVSRTRQPLLGDGDSEWFSSSVVNFGKGATTGWHRHATDQLLVIVHGNGIVANEHESHQVSPCPASLDSLRVFMTTLSVAWTEETLRVAGVDLHLVKGGSGEPLLILNDEVGHMGQLRYQNTAPGLGYEHARPGRLVFDALDELGLSQVNTIGCSLGGWLAAEMATMNPAQFRKLALVGPMGVLPPDGYIYDVFLEVVRTCISTAFLNPEGTPEFQELCPEEATAEQSMAWEVAREEACRLGWKPYMYYPGLPHLLGRLKDLPTMVVWGREDGIVPDISLSAPTRTLVPAIFGATGKPIMDLTVSNGIYDPKLGSELYNRYLDEKMYAEEMGFDGLMLNEHHGTPFCMGGAMNVEASILARMTNRAKIVLLGNILPIWDDPLWLVEQLSMIDMISKGRLVSGWVRGTGRESVAHNSPPPYNWERFQEAHESLSRLGRRLAPSAGRASTSSTVT